MLEPNPDDFIPREICGRKDVFEKYSNEGYTEVAVGVGNLRYDSVTIEGIVFYHPKGKIATYIHSRFMTPDPDPAIGEPFENEYTESEFQKHQQAYQLKVGAKTDLVKIVNEWKE
jgi:hypothetical protein